MAAADSNKVIEIRNLDFSFSTSDGRRKPVLFDINMSVSRGSRLLLMYENIILRPNGAGKSTLLKLLAGRHLTANRDSIMVLGQPAFFQTLGLSGVSFLGNSMWTRSVAFVSSQVTYEADIPVGEMMADLQTEFIERRNELQRILGVNLHWRLNQVSDGQRRRIQIMLGLLRPFQVLLIDEFTVDLDVLCRKDLMDYLKRETEVRNCTILYCTHIFDGLEDWPTELVMMAHGRIKRQELHTQKSRGTLYTIALEFMHEYQESCHTQGGEDAVMLEEEFGGQGFSAGRIQPSTQHFKSESVNIFPANRHASHKS